MCGLTGTYSQKEIDVVATERSLMIMNAAIKHRGPDFDDIKMTSQFCGLGHVRLSIIDVSSASNQPMDSACGRYTIVFNGEIYNFRELKNRYSLKTKTSGDTEVLLEAIATVGLSVVAELNGIFAFALYDRLLNSLTLVRDRFGVKPCYYAPADNQIWFASEIKALTSLPVIKKVFNKNCLSDFFSFLCLPGDKTFFEGIFKVQPGEMVTFSQSGGMEKRFFAQPVSEASDRSTGSHKVLAADFWATVNMQSVADVPLGIFLSGGVDSNALLQGLLNLGVEPQGYNAMFESDHDSYQSELDRVRAVTNSHNLTLNQVNISRKAFWESLDNVIFHQDEPLADPVSVPVYFLSRAVSENGGKVVHVGEGADELFFGYEAWRRLENLQRLQYVQSLLRALHLMPLLSPLARLRRFLPTRFAEAWRRFFLGLPLFWGGTDALTYDEKKQIGLGEGVLRATDVFMKNAFNEFNEKFVDTAPNKWMSYFDLKLRLPELMLMRVDKMAMAHGVEARVPFLDNVLAVRAWNIPISRKRTRSSMKSIFKQSMEGRIDDSILYAKKQGFNAPAEEWCLEAKDAVLRTIRRFCDNSCILDYDGVEKLCSTKPRHLWRIFILARWYELTFSNLDSNANAET